MTATLSEAEMEAWGARIGRVARLPLVLALRGDLGSGKTTLARAIARGAGVEGSVPSPTFNLVLSYETERARIHHLDLYRLERPDEVWELGWADLGRDARDLVLIEWPDRAEALLPEPRWEVRLAEKADPGVRTIEIEPVGEPPELPEPTLSALR